MEKKRKKEKEATWTGYMLVHQGISKTERGKKHNKDKSTEYMPKIKSFKRDLCSHSALLPDYFTVFSLQPLPTCAPYAHEKSRLLNFKNQFTFVLAREVSPFHLISLPYLSLRAAGSPQQ